MRAITDFTKRNGGKAFGAIVSPHLTNEENYRFGEMLDAIGAGRVAMAVRKYLDERGFIGLQVHGIPKGAGPYQVRWRNIRIRELKPGESVLDGR